MTDPYANIRRALEMGPTPGPWKAHDPSESGWVDITNATYATPLCYAAPYSDYQYDAELDYERLVSRAHETPANAAHIAACDPDTIRALLKERDTLEQLLLAYIQVINKIDDRAEYTLPMPSETRSELHAILAALTAKLAAISAANGGGNG